MESLKNVTTQLLAFDFGASSGRAILGNLKNDKLELIEVHRFSNDPVIFSEHLQWDILKLCHEIKRGILKCKLAGYKIESIGVDTWGVDFGLLDEKGELLSNPFHYRDDRTEDMMEKCFEYIPKEELFKRTGLQFAQYNSIYQLLSLVESNSSILKAAHTMLMMPDLFNYMLTGKRFTEFTEFTTSQLYNYEKKTWDKYVIDKLNIPNNIFAPMIMPGTEVGFVKESICRELNIKPIKVIAVGGHDTASAVASVPSTEDNLVFISSGTWSLLGMENEGPIINDKVYKYNFTNEGGTNNKVLLIKNIMGLWIIQECKSAWEKEGISLGFGEIVQMAKAEISGVSFIDPDNQLFYAPGNMPEKVKKFCKNTNQPIPQSIGEVIRCVEESLALKYRWAIEKLEEITNKKIHTINIVGGGIQDKLLCELTASATGRKVIAGPVEATAIGNLIIQAQALGKIKDQKQGRMIIKNSFEMEEYIPINTEQWDSNYLKYLNTLGLE